MTTLEEITNGELIMELHRRGMLTSFKLHPKLLETPDQLKVILTRGVPTDLKECSHCGEKKERNQFQHYQSRVNSRTGFLHPTNSVCRSCIKAHRKELKEACAKADIPPRPSSGAICPHCERSWTGAWQRHHEPGGDFKAWLCGHCNMSFSDHRNKNVVNKKRKIKLYKTLDKAQ